MEGNNQNLEQQFVLSNKKIFLGLMLAVLTVFGSTLLLSFSQSDISRNEAQYEFRDASARASELFKAPVAAELPKSSGDLRLLPPLSYRLENFEDDQDLLQEDKAESIDEEPQGKSTPPELKAAPPISLEQRLLEEALKAPAQVNLDFSEPNISQSSAPATQALSPGPKNSTAALGSAPNGTLAAYSKFENDAYINPHELEEVRSPYVLLQGSLIPAVLLTGINSALPGQISAQVTTNIYDSLSGDILLIPSGSRLIGQYASSVEMGMERVFSGFSRLILPDGSSLNLSSMPGQGLDGYSGLEAEVDNHYGRILLDSLLLAGFATAEAIVSRDVYDDKGNPRPTALMAQQFETQLGQASSRLLERHINLAPTLNVKPGTMFNIAVVKDLYFKGNYEE